MSDDERQFPAPPALLSKACASAYDQATDGMGKWRQTVSDLLEQLDTTLEHEPDGPMRAVLEAHEALLQALLLKLEPRA